MSDRGFDRRSLLKISAVGLGTFVAGCDQTDQISNDPTDRNILDFASKLNYKVQRLLLRSDDLAREYPASDITAQFRSNGTSQPPGKAYKALQNNNFADWRLIVDGLVDNPLELSLADLRAMPARTQITRHDCVEGWSCIGQWTGTPLSGVLALAKLKPTARYVVFYCADAMEGDPDADTDTSDTATAGAADASDTDAPASPGAPAPTPNVAANPNGVTSTNAVAGDTDASTDATTDATLDDQPVFYYSSIDLVDAMHPQTILAYEMDGKTLPVPYGAPLRVRVERQLGYKMPKYIMRISLVDSYAGIAGGRGGYWEDQGYEWFAGI